MALNKDKVIAAAQRFTQKGQLDRAIKEYRSIVDEDPDDIRIWLKIGDLYTRKGAVSHAVQTYVRVADHYRDRGFVQKAVAVYRSILKIDSGYIDGYLALGELCIKLSQVPDAIVQFQIVVGAYERQGRARESLDLLRRIVELAPEDVPNRIRLAEGHAGQGESALAIAQFNQVLTHLEDRKRFDEFVQVGERVLYLAPDNLDVVRRLGEIYVRVGEPKRALARLQVAFRADPRDPATLDLLARTFVALEQEFKAVSVYRELARIHTEAGRPNAANKTWRRLLNLDPADPEALEATGAAVEADLQGGRADTGGFEQLSAAEQVHLFLSDVDLLLKYELTTHALARAAKALALNPQHGPALRKHADLLTHLRRNPEAVVSLLQLARIEARGDAREARRTLEEALALEPENPEVRARLDELMQQPAAPVHASAAVPGSPQAPIQLGAPMGRAGRETGSLELDLDQLDLDGELGFDDDLGSAALDFEPGDGDVIDPQAGDAMAEADFGGVLADALDSGEGAGVDPVFGGLLGDAPRAPAPQRAAMAPAPMRGQTRAAIAPPPPSSDAFGDLLAGPASAPAEAGAFDFDDGFGGGFGGDGFGGDSAFGDLPSMEEVPDDDAFSDLLSEPAPPPSAPAPRANVRPLIIAPPPPEDVLEDDFEASQGGDFAGGDFAGGDIDFGELPPAPVDSLARPVWDDDQARAAEDAAGAVVDDAFAALLADEPAFPDDELPATHDPLAGFNFEVPAEAAALPGSSARHLAMVDAPPPPDPLDFMEGLAAPRPARALSTAPPPSAAEVHAANTTPPGAENESNAGLLHLGDLGSFDGMDDLPPLGADVPPDLAPQPPTPAVAAMPPPPPVRPVIAPPSPEDALPEDELGGFDGFDDDFGEGAGFQAEAEMTALPSLVNDAPEFEEIEELELLDDADIELLDDEAVELTSDAPESLAPVADSAPPEPLTAVPELPPALPPSRPVGPPSRPMGRHPALSAVPPAHPLVSDVDEEPDDLAAVLSNAPLAMRPSGLSMPPPVAAPASLPPLRMDAAAESVEAQSVHPARSEQLALAPDAELDLDEPSLAALAFDDGFGVGPGPADDLVGFDLDAFEEGSESGSVAAIDRTVALDAADLDLEGLMGRMSAAAEADAVEAVASAAPGAAAMEPDLDFGDGFELPAGSVEADALALAMADALSVAENAGPSRASQDDAVPAAEVEASVAADFGSFNLDADLVLDGFEGESLFESPGAPEAESGLSGPGSGAVLPSSEPSSADGGDASQPGLDDFNLAEDAEVMAPMSADATAFLDADALSVIRGASMQSAPEETSAIEGEALDLDLDFDGPGSQAPGQASEPPSASGEIALDLDDEAVEASVVPTSVPTSVAGADAEPIEAEGVGAGDSDPAAGSSESSQRSVPQGRAIPGRSPVVAPVGRPRSPIAGAVAPPISAMLERLARGGAAAPAARPAASAFFDIVPSADATPAAAPSEGVTAPPVRPTPPPRSAPRPPPAPPAPPSPRGQVPPPSSPPGGHFEPSQPAGVVDAAPALAPEAAGAPAPVTIQPSLPQPRVPMPPRPPAPPRAPTPPRPPAPPRPTLSGLVTPASAPVADRAPIGPPAAQALIAQPPRPPLDLSEVDFLLENHLADDAEELIAELEKRHAGHPDLVERRARMTAMRSEVEADEAVLGGLFDETADLGSIQGAQLSDLGGDDAATHFDLGVAFREMQQYRKAVEQLELAARAPALRPEALRVLALCHLDQGDAPKAVSRLEEALALPGLSDGSRAGLEYDLASAFESMGQPEAAREHLSSLAARDPGFQDVRARLKRLGG